MSAENDPPMIVAIGKYAWGLVILILGWFHLRQSNAERIINGVNVKLSEFYMKREEVRSDIREARQDLRHDMSNAVNPICDRLTKIEASLEKLTNALIHKK